MTSATFTEAELASLLRMAESAHHTYEEQLGRRDEGWANWYAHWIFVQKSLAPGRENMERNP